jgi:cytochrome c551
MISARMRRPMKVLLIASAATVVAALTAACGTQNINVPKSDPPDIHHGALLFSQRCAGCHTLSYAATNGSASNVRTRIITNGPNFDQRCERPVTRVLYAIQNGGFSGAIMPQNVVVGKDATDVANFVAKYAGRSAPKITGQTPCASQPIGALPAPASTTSTTSSSTTTSSTTSTTSSTTTSSSKHKKKKK